MARPFLFNPGRASPDELERTFVARGPILDQLQTALQVDAQSRTRRHWLVIGPRGTGKSHLTNLLAHRLRALGTWLVVQLPEEHYQISSLGDLLEQVVVRLCAGPSPFGHITEPDVVADTAAVWLRNHVEKEHKPLVVIVENLGKLFSRQMTSSRDHAALRRLLSTDPPFILVGTATSLPAEVSKHAAPFYDFFQMLPLDDLTPEEARALVRQRLAWDGESPRLPLDQVDARLSAVLHFSGGNPRLVLALYSVLRDGLSVDVHTQILALLDEVTPYYQARLDDISPQMARILVELAVAPGPVTPAEIGRTTRLPTSQVTSNIARLQAERFVMPGGRPDKRSRRWELSDRLFRIWLQMREDRSSRRRLRFLAEFYERWYSDDRKGAESALEEAGSAFWRDLKDGAVSACGSHLLEAEYLTEAARAPSPVMAIYRALSSAAPSVPPNVEELERAINNVPAEYRPLLRVLLAKAVLFGGDGRRAIAILGPILDDVVPALSVEPVRCWLDAHRAAYGEDATEATVDDLVARFPREVTVLREAAVFHAGRIDGGMRAEDLLKRSQTVDDCPHCNDRTAMRVAVAAGSEGSLRSNLVRDAVPYDEDSKYSWSILRELLNIKGGAGPAPLMLLLSERTPPEWAPWEAACVLTHQRHFAEALVLLRALSVTADHADPFLVPHLIEIAVQFAAMPDDLVAWLRAADADLKQMWLGIYLENLARDDVGSALQVYQRMVTAEILPADFPPWSAAAKAFADRTTLDGLHQEEREAVELLLGTKK